MKRDANARRKGEQELALDESGFEAARHDAGRQAVARRCGHAASLLEGLTVTLCPIAIAVTCRKCPIVSVCPVKTVIGDYVEPKIAKPAKAKTKKN